MYSMSKCNSNGTLSTTLSSVSFDTLTGKATFSNLTINLKGMYTIMINVKTLNSNDYSFSCISQPVLVKASMDSILTATATTEPDIYLTFTGNFTAQSTDSLKTYQAMLYNCMLSSYGILIQRQITLYSGSVKAAIGTSGDASAYNSLVSGLNNSNFSLADGVVLQSAIINSQTYNFTNFVSSPSSSSSDSSISQQNAVRKLFFK